MTTNFSVSDAAVQAYVDSGGIEVTRYRQNGSAILQAVARSGGEVFPGLAPVPTTIPVFSGQTKIDAQAESTRTGSNSAPQSSRDVEGRNLLVAPHTEYEQTTDQAMRARLHGMSDPDAFGARLSAVKSPAIFAGFDADVLSDVLTGPTDVEWAGNGITALNTALATYDETAYNGDAMVVTRKGARLFGLAENADNMLQFPGGLQNIPFNGPIIQTDATAADIGTPNLLAVIFPAASCAVGWAGETEIKLFDQVEQTVGGALQNLLTWKVQRYLGFIQPSTSVIPATAYVTITDDS